MSRIAYQAGSSAGGKAVVSEVSVSHQCRPDSAFGDVASRDLDLTGPAGTDPVTVILSAADAFYATNLRLVGFGAHPGSCRGTQAS